MDSPRRRDRCAGELDRSRRHAETVAKALFEYYKLGAASLLIRGYDPRPDAIQYGEELIPRIRELVAAYDAERGPL